MGKIKKNMHLQEFIFCYEKKSNLYWLADKFCNSPWDNSWKNGLTLTLFLCLINIFNSITYASPDTKSFTSISIWMVACISLVTSALLQYGIILLFWKYSTYDQNIVRMFLKKIDVFCLVLEILAFIVFNIIFWTTRETFTLWKHVLKCIPI